MSLPAFNLSLGGSPAGQIALWLGDAVAALSGVLKPSDYLRLREELIKGMLRAGANDQQIAAALTEMNRHILSSMRPGIDVQASIKQLGSSLTWGAGAIGTVVGAVANPIAPLLWPLGLLVGGVLLLQSGVLRRWFGPS